MSLFFEIIPAIFRQTCMTAIWFLTRQLKHVTTCDNMLHDLLRTVPLPPGLQDRGPHHLQHLPAEPSPAGGNSSYVIAGFAVYLKRNACFVFTSKPLMLLGMSFQCRIRFWFLVSGDLIQHDSSLMLYLYIYTMSYPFLRCTLIWSAIREGIPGSMRPSSRLSHSHDESWTAYNACNM